MSPLTSTPPSGSYGRVIVSATMLASEASDGSNVRAVPLGDSAAVADTRRWLLRFARPTVLRAIVSSRVSISALASWICVALSRMT